MAVMMGHKYGMTVTMGWAHVWHGGYNEAHAWHSAYNAALDALDLHQST